MKYFGRIGQLGLIIGSTFLTAQVAMAGLTLAVNPAVSYQQTTNNPCVIGDPSCKQPATMYQEQESGTPGASNSTYNLYSPVYLAGNPANLGSNIIPLSFIIGIDENFSNDPEYLVSFSTYYCTAGAVGTADTTSTNGIGTPPPTSGPGTYCGATQTLDTANSYAGPTTQLLTHNGNGYSDALLSTLSLVSGRYYFFEAVVSNDTDGMEEFFIIPSGAVPYVPEPSSVLLLGTALLGVGGLLRKKLTGRS